MFGLFKSNPIAKLEKQHKKLLEQAFHLSKSDRKKSDELMFQADEIERKIEKLKNS